MLLSFQCGVPVVESRIYCTAKPPMICTSLEPAGVEHILGHSTETHTLRYTELDGRGDGTSHQQVKDVHSHAGIEVTKHGCIGHVQKGMGTVLKKLKKETPGQIKGKLTDAMKKKMSNYWGIALWSNVGNLEGMKKEVLASTSHCTSNQPPLSQILPLVNSRITHFSISESCIIAL